MGEVVLDRGQEKKRENDLGPVPVRVRCGREKEERALTEKEQLLAMLAHASTEEWQTGLSVTQEPENEITIHTGRDDAIAVFTFDETGTLVKISVDEC